MIRFTKETILSLHQRIAKQTGGDDGLRDPGLLQSALASPFQTFDGEDLYPTLEEKGARLGYALISNHAFTDGNKRIGIFALLLFLEVNDRPIRPTPREVVELTLSVAAGQTDYPALLAWVKAHRCQEKGA